MTPAIAQFKTEFERARRWRRLRSEPLQVGDLRWEALDRFLALGFPTPDDEDWRLTELGALPETIFTLASAPADAARSLSIAPLWRSDDSSAELIFVDGYYVPEASSAALPAGVRAGSLAAALESDAAAASEYLTRVAPVEHQIFLALNTALFPDGAFIFVPPNTVIEKPIHLRFVSSGDADRRPAMSHPRVLAILGEGSRATIVETYTGPQGVEYLTNTVAEILLDEGASLDYYTLQNESRQAYHTSAMFVAAARAADFRACQNSFGGMLVRNDVVATLSGEGAKCAWSGLYTADGRRLVDHHIVIDHVLPNCASSLALRGILAGQASSVFDSKIWAGADAHQCQLEQSNEALLLSPDARASSAWHQEIVANDVRCNQQSIRRSVDEEVASAKDLAGARRRVSLGFVRQALDEIHLGALQTGVDDILQRELGHFLGPS